MIECCYDPIIPFDYYIALSTRVIGVFMQSFCSIYLSFIFTHSLIIWIKFMYVNVQKNAIQRQVVDKLC